MKSTWVTMGVAVLSVVVLSSFVLHPKDDQEQKAKKSRHIRLVKIEDGKRMEIDTVFTTDDVFVWHGDTINPMKHNGNVRMQYFGKGDDKANVVYIKQRKGDKNNAVFFDREDARNMEIITDDNDSTGKRVVVREIRKGKPVDHMIYFNRQDINSFPPVPPMPPMPPVPHVKMFGMKHSGKVIDLNDPNVISYKKKDLSGGREKIEIIRKKTDEKEEAAFHLQFDNDALLAPEAPDAPEAPEMIWESKDDSVKTKIIERKKIIKGKEGKEIEVNVESEKK